MTIRLQGIKKAFSQTQVLKGIDWQIETPSQWVIRGASGSGKSTLLYLMGALDRPTEGKLEIFGKNLAEMNDAQRAYFRNRVVGFVFQFHFLLPSMNCLNNLLLPAKIGGVNQEEITERVQRLAQFLEVSHCLQKYPYQISGGEQQRVNIIRALSLGPRLLLCDEPTGNLDSRNSQKVTELLRNLAQEFKATLIMVTHDRQIAAQFDNELVMVDGVLYSEKQ